MAGALPTLAEGDSMLDRCHRGGTGPHAPVGDTVSTHTVPAEEAQ